MAEIRSPSIRSCFIIAAEIPTNRSRLLPHRVQFPFLLAVCLIAGSLVFGQSLQNHLRAALDFQQHGQDAAAIAEYKAALVLAPDHPEIWTNLGAAYAHRGDYIAAADAYHKALALNSTYGPALLNLGLTYYKTGQLDAAIKTLSDYRAGAAADERAALLLADCYLRTAQYARTIAVAEPLEQAHPGDLGIAYVLGTAYIRHGDTEKGEELVNRILSAGDSAPAHMMMGDAYAQSHQMGKAKQEYERALQLNPKIPLGHLRLAEAEVTSGDSDGAFEQFKAEYAVDPADYETNFYLGYILRERNDLAAAEPYLRRALTMRPDAYQPNLQLALLEFEKNDLQSARQLLQRAIRANPGETEPHVILGRIDYRLHLNAEGASEQKIVRDLNAKRQKESIQQRVNESESLGPLPPGAPAGSGSGPAAPAAEPQAPPHTVQP
jgi:tetratricopeptide (TPR) repeat protein